MQSKHKPCRAGWENGTVTKNDLVLILFLTGSCRTRSGGSHRLGKHWEWLQVEPG